MVFEVDAVKFLVVVGKGIGAGHVAVVTTTILVLEVEDFAGDGACVEGEGFVLV